MSHPYMTLEQLIESVCSGRHKNKTDLLEDVNPTPKLKPKNKK